MELGPLVANDRYFSDLGGRGGHPVLDDLTLGTAFSVPALIGARESGGRAPAVHHRPTRPVRSTRGARLAGSPRARALGADRVGPGHLRARGSTPVPGVVHDF